MAKKASPDKSAKAEVEPESRIGRGREKSYIQIKMRDKGLLPPLKKKKSRRRKKRPYT